MNTGIIKRSRIAPEIRFWNFVKIDSKTGCWNWTGFMKKGALGGYGYFADVPGRSVMAYKFSYEMFVGPVLPGMELDHFCRNRACVNPAHLEQVTHATNMHRSSTMRTHCRNGHPMTEENIYRVPSRENKVCCRACHKACSVKSDARRVVSRRAL